MDFEEYRPLALRTAKMRGSSQKDLEHALLGMVTELGEVATEVKRFVIYGKPLDEAMQQHMIEELGDCMWYLPLAMLALDIRKPLPKPPIQQKDAKTDWASMILRMQAVIGILAMQHVYMGTIKDADKMLGELLGLLERCCEILGYSPGHVRQKNIDKLRDRYPQHYSDYHAEARLDKDGASARES